MKIVNLLNIVKYLINREIILVNRLILCKIGKILVNREIWEIIAKILKKHEILVKIGKILDNREILVKNYEYS